MPAHLWLRIYVRVMLGTTMMSYGAFKLIPTQFPAPLLATLIQPYGQVPPMELLWMLVGFSRAYGAFGGCGEMIGGILVLIPGLTTLGALILAGVLTNVFMLNMCYDVPVKILSFHLLLLCAFLAGPDLRRLCDFFLFHRRAELTPEPALFTRRKLNQRALAVQLLLALFFVGNALHQSWQGAKQYGFLAPRPPLYGIWNVEQFTLTGEVHPPLLTDDVRWQRAVFENPQELAVQQMDGKLNYFSLGMDSAKKKLTLGKADDKRWKAELTVAQPQSGVLILDGLMDGQPVHILARLTDPSKFLLLSRGFHWINEHPFGR